MVYRILVGSYTNEITTLTFDPAGPSLTVSSSLTVGHHPSWITPHPTNNRLVFTGLEQADGKIVAIKYDEEGRGTVVGETPSGGADPCTLAVADEELLVGNYSSGAFVVIPLSSEPPHLVASGTATITFTGTGPNEVRQEASHPHQIAPFPARHEVLVPDLGADKTRRLVRGADGRWTEQGAVSYKPGSGPRHVAVHDNVLYTVLELTSSLSAHRFPPLPGEATHLHTVSTLRDIPAPAQAAEMLAAEILLPTPNAAFGTPYVYVSNRNDPSPAGDTIAIFSALRDDEKIELVAEVRSGLKHLRGMVFGGPDDKWLVAGGVNGGGVKIFERVDGGKGLREVASVHVDSPTGFLWL